MPAGALSATISSSVYLVSVLLLLGVLFYPAHAIFDLGRQRAASSIAQGVATELNSLSPGMSSLMEVDQIPGADIAISLGAHSVTVSVDGTASSASVRWYVPPLELAAGRAYGISLEGEVVKFG